MDLRRIKKLNEEMRRLLNMSEISDELKQKVRDTRKANYLAAQATADMAQANADKLKAKYDRINKRVQIDKEEYKNISTTVKDEVKKLFNRGYASLSNIGNSYVIEVDFYGKNVEDITQTALEQLEELLAKMTKTYGLNYSYEVKNNQIIIKCEQPQNYHEPDIITQLKNGTFDGEPIIGLYEIYKNLDKLSVDDIVQMMGKHKQNYNCYLFPSDWNSAYIRREVNDLDKYGIAYDEGFEDFMYDGYPEKFAQALIKTEAQDSLGDLWNMYYSNRSISYDAQDVFEEDAINNMDYYVGNWLQGDVITLNNDGTVVLDKTQVDPILNFDDKLYNALLQSILQYFGTDHKDAIKTAFEELKY